MASEKVERLITTLEDAAQMATQMPVQLQNGHGAHLGFDTWTGIPMVYWNAVVAALNEVVKEIDGVTHA